MRNRRLYSQVRNRDVPPTKTELEVSIFGRGFGECICVHVGDNNWIIVDSLLDEDGIPPVLKYLESLKVDIAASVNLLVATHWHDDHAAGLHIVYEKATSALLSLPAALNDDEMIAYCERVSEGGSEKISSGVQELADIATTQSETSRRAFRLAKANQTLLRIHGDKISHALDVQVESLSPSDLDSQTFIKRLAVIPPLLPGARAEPFERNDISVALWISVGDHKILLGADLENVPNPQRGWQAVLSSPALPSGKAAVVKIPHHGSDNAHSDQIWAQIIQSNPLASLTTWNRGRKLPKESDVARILSLTDTVFATSALERRSQVQLAAVRKTLKESGTTMYSRPKVSGHVRFRLELQAQNPAWTHQLFDGARHLRELEAS